MFRMFPYIYNFMNSEGIEHCSPHSCIKFERHVVDKASTSFSLRDHPRRSIMQAWCYAFGVIWWNLAMESKYTQPFSNLLEFYRVLIKTYYNLNESNRDNILYTQLQCLRVWKIIIPFHVPTMLSNLLCHKPDR